MARRHYRKRKFKLKLKNETVYSIFSFGLILAGIILGLSFSGGGGSLTSVNEILKSYFGAASYLFPLVLILFGFLFLRLRLFLSRPHVALGFIIIFVALDGLLKGGILGLYLFQALADIITSAGAYLVYAVGIFIGIIVLFNTSIDELVAFAAAVGDVFQRLFPKKLLSFFKSKNESFSGNKQLTIKGDKDFATASAASPVVKKPPALISDRLVANT